MSASTCFLACALLLTLAGLRVPAADARLWEIGREDGSAAEFALAPGDYAKFSNDGFFVVGKSATAQDWPYVQPGPVDAWAGSRSHTFNVVFGVRAAVREGQCRLRILLLDTQAAAPPKLGIRLNGVSFEQSLPGGAGDASVKGDFRQGHRHTVDLAIPASALVAGDNQLGITTTSGSWLLYDAVLFDAPSSVESAPVVSPTVVEAAQPVLALRREGKGYVQPVRVTLRHGGGVTDARVKLEGAEPVTMKLAGNAAASVEVLVPAVDRERSRKLVVEVAGKTLLETTVRVKPVRQLTVYILPHSHTDIGYTEIQTAIEAKQVENLRKGIAYAQRTASYPEGARFVWNVEVLWAADLYLRRLPEPERQAFFEAVRRGQVVLNGMYLNELTGLCRPEELLQLFRYATQLSRETGVPIDSAMISDVPGYTWGTVSAMAHAGIRYFSTAPNYFDRIGDILRKWENKPFWWVGPSGQERVLVWIPFKGYAMSHVYGQLTPAFVTEYLGELERTQYPYDLAYMRWSGHGDNAEPDPAICEFVKDWNAQYAWPKFVISGTGEAFRAFEKRYGKDLPEVRGDWTPYWEDGAGSSALETSLNRASSDLVDQAATLYALRQPRAYPVERFREAWDHVLLYSEHTWGAWCSVSDPEAQATKEQWEIKQSYAQEARRRSRQLLLNSLGWPTNGGPAAKELEVINSSAWSRGGLIQLPRALSGAGDAVLDDRGAVWLSQRLSDGSLAVQVPELPPYGTRRFQVTSGGGVGRGTLVAEGTTLRNDKLRMRLDPTTGAIVELLAPGAEGNLVDTAEGQGLNDFLFLPGDDLKNLQRNGAVRISVQEKGPLVASLRVQSEAPGCRGLSREVRLVAGADYVELINTVDKARASISTRTNDWQFAQKGGKESVNFAFPFRVPEGELRLELPFGVIRPEADQMPSACKNWFTVGRWADVSNRRNGVTWVTLDAPLVQVGGITATLVGSQSKPEVWRKHVEPTQKIYSWAMNNHWGTNYRAYQEGPVVFRFLLRPHGKYDAAENSRFAIGASQELVVRPAEAPGASEAAPGPRPLVTPADVLVLGMKPSDDGKATLVRLYGASGQTRKAKLAWVGTPPSAVTVSDLGEHPGAPVRGAVEVPGFGVVTLRVE